MIFIAWESFFLLYSTCIKTSVITDLTYRFPPTAQFEKPYYQESTILKVIEQNLA